jgi:hypothetical protein
MSRVSAKLLEPIAITQEDERNHSIECVNGAQRMIYFHNEFFKSLRAAYGELKVCTAVEGSLPMAIEPRYHRTLLIISQLCEHLQMHHSIEETYIFPQIDRCAGKPLMMSEVEQHREIHIAIDALMSFVRKELRSKGEIKKENVETFIKLLDDMAVPLSQHLRDEIKTLLSLDDYMAPQLVKRCLMG